MDQGDFGKCGFGKVAAVSDWQEVEELLIHDLEDVDICTVHEGAKALSLGDDKGMQWQEAKRQSDLKEDGTMPGGGKLSRNSLHD